MMQGLWNFWTTKPQDCEQKPETSMLLHTFDFLGENSSKVSTKSRVVLISLHKHILLQNCIGIISRSINFICPVLCTKDFT